MPHALEIMVTIISDNPSHPHGDGRGCRMMVAMMSCQPEQSGEQLHCGDAAVFASIAPANDPQATSMVLLRESWR